MSWWSLDPPPTLLRSASPSLQLSAASPSARQPDSQLLLLLVRMAARSTPLCAQVSGSQHLPDPVAAGLIAFLSAILWAGLPAACSAPGGGACAFEVPSISPWWCGPVMLSARTCAADAQAAVASPLTTAAVLLSTETVHFSQGPHPPAALPWLFDHHRLHHLPPLESGSAA